VFGFRKLVPLLRQAGYAPVIVEPLGTGFSGRPPHADYSLWVQSVRLAKALDSLGIRHALFIAHSAGGAMALRVAYQRPDLVEGLLSLEGGPTEIVATKEFRRAALFIPWIKLLGGAKLIRRVVRKTLIASSGDGSWVTDSVVNGYTAGAAANLDATLRSYIAMANSREREPLRPHLHEIRCPVRLLIGGTRHDGGLGSGEVTELQTTIPDFAADTVAGAGHYLQEEQPQWVMTAFEALRIAASNTHRD
jgi:pimeloyl-ACP methyl ester carboxylesterase